MKSKLKMGMLWNLINENLWNLPKEKNGQAPFIAPLQPSTLAVFPPWGSSKGAGRKRLARHKSKKKKEIKLFYL